MSHRVDFYLLNKAADDKWLYACRLLEKAYRLGHRVFVFCDNQQNAEHLDELLWTYKDNSFIPHNLQGEGPEPPPPVQIGYQAEPRGFNDILLNLSSTVPAFFSRFNRIIEIVPEDEQSKEISRENYRTYRNAQCKIQTHQISS